MWIDMRRVRGVGAALLAWTGLLACVPASLAVKAAAPVGGTAAGLSAGTSAGASADPSTGAPASPVPSARVSPAAVRSGAVVSAGADHGAGETAGAQAPSWQRIPIVMYHHSNYGITTKLFRAQMAWLHEQGYSTLLTNDLLAFVRTGRAVPERSIVLTFDDIGNNGHYADIRDVVLPELRRYGFKAIFGIITCGVSVGGQGHHYTWGEIKQWADSGDIEVASHSVTHPNMAKLSDAELRKELVDSKAAIEKGTGHRVRVMIWPGGNRSDRAEEAARVAGYEVCMRVWDGWVKPRSDPMKLQRIRPYGTLDEFEQRVLKQGRRPPPGRIPSP